MESTSTIREQWREASKRYRERHPERHRAGVRKADALRRFTRQGWTHEMFLEAWQAQEGRCAVCQRKMLPSGRKSESVVVDHCHRTGKPRGLLCSRCNGVLSRLEVVIRVLSGHQPSFSHQLRGQLVTYLCEHTEAENKAELERALSLLSKMDV